MLQCKTATVTHCNENPINLQHKKKVSTLVFQHFHGKCLKQFVSSLSSFKKEKASHVALKLKCVQGDAECTNHNLLKIDIIIYIIITK